MTDTYSSQADLYGSDGLMRMAGTLAERAESDLTALEADSRGKAGHPLTHIIARALVANAYAMLSQAAAMRERTDIVSEVLASAPGEPEELPSLDPNVDYQRQRFLGI